jgi:hypothetical protein
LIDPDVALHYIKFFKDKVESWIPKKFKRSDEDDEEEDYAISDDEEKAKIMKKVSVNEVIKSIAMLFDCFIVHDFLSKQKLQDASKDVKFMINDVKTLLVKKISVGNKSIQQVILEGFYKLIIMDKLQKPVDILARIMVLLVETKPNKEKQHKKIRKSIKDFIVQYAKISKSACNNLFRAL